MTLQTANLTEIASPATANDAERARERLNWGGILLLALLLRLIWWLAVPVSPVSDSTAYDAFARNLARGFGYGWYPGNLTAHWPVGTSAVYAVLYKVFGFHYTPIVVLNLVLSMATIWFGMRLAAIWFGPRAARITGILLAVWPTLVFFTTVLASELLFNFLLFGWLLLWERRHHLPPWLFGVCIGIIGAATCYVRPTALLIPGLLAVLEVLRTREWRRALIATVVTYVVMLALIAPWSVRNTRLFGRFVHIATNGGVNLWEGNNPTSNGETEEIPAAALHMQEADRDAYLGAQAKAYIRAYPGRFVVRTIKKSVLLYDRETIGVHWNLDTLERRYGAHVISALKLVSDAFWYVVFLASLAGLVIYLRMTGFLPWLTHPAVALWVYFTAVNAVIVVQDRYHFCSIPFIAAFAALAATRFYSRRQSQLPVAA